MADIQYLRLTEKDHKKFGNPLWRITHWYWIQTKKAGVRTLLSPRRAQRKIMRVLAVWNKLMILKCRQLGVSTFLLIWHLDATMMTPDTTTCILAHEQKALDTLFRIIKIAYESCPDNFELDSGDIWHKPMALYDTKNELYFEGLNSKIYVALQVRSATVHRLHVSEAHFIKHAEDVMTATMGAVPDDGIVTIETTGNGIGGMFHEDWLDAIDPNTSSPFSVLFLGYQDSEEYMLELDDKMQFRKTMTQEEKGIHKKHGVSLEHIAWRRKKRADPKVRKKFEQEFPCHWKEAFMHTGSGIFDVDMLDDWIIRDPIERRKIGSQDGDYVIWKKVKKGEQYIVSGDMSSGEGKTSASAKQGGTDYCVLEVINARTLQVVAMFRGKHPYARMHEVAEKIAREYNKAYIIIETYPSAHGLTVVNNLWHHTNYPHELIHTEKHLEKTTDRNKRRLGWYTTEKSKVLIIDELQNAVLEGTVRVHSRTIQSEMFTFINHDNGSMGAIEGYKDDTVMALGIGTYSKNIALALKAMRDYTKVSKKSLGFK